MPTKKSAPGNEPTPAGATLSTKDLTSLLIKHYGFHEGFYDLYIEYRMAFGIFGPNEAEALPGVTFGMGNFSVTRVDVLGPLSVDAAEVNPKVAKVAKTVKRASRSMLKA